MNSYDDLTGAGGAILDIVRAWPNGNLTGVLGESLNPERVFPCGTCCLPLSCCSAASTLSKAQRSTSPPSCPVSQACRPARASCCHLEECSSRAASLCAGVMGFHAAPLNPMGGIGNVTHGCPIRVSIQQVESADAGCWTPCLGMALSGDLGPILLAA